MQRPLYSPARLLTRVVALLTFTLVCLSPLRISAQDSISAPNDVSLRVASITTSSAVSDTIIVTLYSNPIPRYTSNNGIEWREVATSPWVFGDENAIPSMGLARRLEEGFPQRIIVLPGRGYPQDVSALYRSGDNGVTWTKYVFTDGDCVWHQFSNTLAAPNAPNRLYLLHTCVVASGDYYKFPTHLYISNNAGVDWERQGLAASPVSNTDIAEFHLSPVVTDRLYIYTDSRWMQSDNSGESWAVQEFPIVSLTLDSQAAQWLYGLTPFDTVEISERIGMRSEDGGNTWVAWKLQPCPFGLNLSPGNGNVQLMAHPTQSKVLFVRCDQGLYRSNNGGESWTQLTNFPGQLLAPDYGHAGRILWGRDDGLWVSADDGNTWQNVMPNYATRQPERIYLPGIITNN